MSETKADQDLHDGSAGAVAHRWVWVFGTAAAVLVADQLTKWWAVDELAPSATSPGRIVDVFWKLRFNYAENTGMAFSQGASSGRWIGLIVIVIVVALVLFAARSHSRTQVILLGVIIGGALGNLVDRAARADEGWLTGAVVDFIDFQFWPVFNIVDAAVVVGGLLLVLVSLREPDDGDADGAEPIEDPGATGDPGRATRADDRSDDADDGSDDAASGDAPGAASPGRDLAAGQEG